MGDGPPVGRKGRGTYAVSGVRSSVRGGAKRVYPSSTLSRRLCGGRRYRAAAKDQMGVVFAATQENPVALGTRRIEGRELAGEWISREVPVAAYVELQNIAFEKARRMLPQLNVDPSNLATRQGFGAVMG